MNWANLRGRPSIWGWLWLWWWYDEKDKDDNEEGYDVVVMTKKIICEVK